MDLFDGRKRAIGLAFWKRNVWSAAERAYVEGWISENKFQAQLNDVEFTASQWPGLKPYLRASVEALEPERQLTAIEARVMEVTR